MTGGDNRAGSAAPAAGAANLGGRVVAFKRLYRWLNLTLVQHAPWPLLLLLAGAPAASPGRTPMPWYAARVAAPALASALALLTLHQRPQDNAAAVQPTADEPGVDTHRALRTQARVGLFSLTAMLAVARLAAGPSLVVAKQLGFGAADVAAFQLINFGVAARSYHAAARGDAVVVLLFGLSWGLRDTMLAALGSAASLPLAAAGGFVVGIAFGLLSRAMRRWLGGFWPAAAVQGLLVYLVAGFVR